MLLRDLLSPLGDVYSTEDIFMEENTLDIPSHDDDYLIHGICRTMKCEDCLLK